MTETLGSGVDTCKKKNTESLVLPVLYVAGYKTSGIALIHLQDQQQNELWEEAVFCGQWLLRYLVYNPLTMFSLKIYIVNFS